MPITTNQFLLSNSPEMELTPENDAFGVLDKANFIKNLIIDENDILGKNKMLVLFGGWGSGKSTVMHYIKKELEKEEYPVVFFEAWKFEKDNNLPLSLIAAISDSCNSKEIDELKSISLSYFKSVFGSLELDLGILKIKPKDGFDVFDAEIERVERAYSAYDHLKEFEEKFKNAEQSIIDSKCKTSSKKKLIVFIDDLDRCEPEHTLGLLTAIKLFFTYGENTIFICGVDKEAIRTALLTKYNDNVKADEYLEKVFDISFTMPVPVSVSKQIQVTLNKPSDEKEKISEDLVNFIAEFFKAIDFKNPRHIKKVLNKFELLKSFKSSFKDKELGAIIPNNLETDKWEIVFTLYFIILYEFHYEKFVELENWEFKKTIYAQNIIDKSGVNANPGSFTSVFSNNDLYYPIREQFSLKNVELDRKSCLLKLIIFFLPIHSSHKFDLNANIDQIKSIIAQFESENNRLLVSFCQFLHDKIKNESLISASDFLIWNYFNMARIML